MGIFYTRNKEVIITEVTLEILNEDNILTYEKYTISANFDQGRGYSEANAYFKIYKQKNVLQEARIHFYNADYEYHNNDNLKSRFYLINKEKKLLMKLLSKQSKRYPDYTIWQETIATFNKYSKDHIQSATGHPFIIPLTLEMPDYNLLP